MSARVLIRALLAGTVLAALVAGSHTALTMSGPPATVAVREAAPPSNGPQIAGLAEEPVPASPSTATPTAERAATDRTTVDDDDRRGTDPPDVERVTEQWREACESGRLRGPICAGT